MSIISERLDSYITSIVEHKDVLSPNQLKELKGLLSNEVEPQKIVKFTPSELDTLFTLVTTLQRKVVTNDSNLLDSATTRDLSSLIGGITSLLRAFAVQQAKVNEAKEMGTLKEAVIAAIKPLDSAAQQRFYDTLESYT